MATTTTTMTPAPAPVPIQAKEMVTTTMPIYVQQGRQNVTSILPSHVVGLHSKPFFCETCQREQYSRTERKCTSRSCLKITFCGACIAALAFFGCILIPITGCRTVFHYCPQCGTQVGRTEQF